MSAFTSESLVRVKFQWNSATDVPATLINDAIAEAHAYLLRAVAPAHLEVPPPAEVVIGETLLAGARTARALATREAATRVRVTIAGQSVDRGPRHVELLALSDLLEQQANAMLAPFFHSIAAAAPLLPSDTTPILRVT